MERFRRPEPPRACPLLSRLRDVRSLRSALPVAGPRGPGPAGARARPAGTVARRGSASGQRSQGGGLVHDGGAPPAAPHAHAVPLPESHRGQRAGRAPGVPDRRRRRSPGQPRLAARDAGARDRRPGHRPGQAGAAAGGTRALRDACGGATGGRSPGGHPRHVERSPRMGEARPARGPRARLSARHPCLDLRAPPPPARSPAELQHDHGPARGRHHGGAAGERLRDPDAAAGDCAVRLRRHVRGAASAPAGVLQAEPGARGDASGCRRRSCSSRGRARPGARLRPRRSRRRPSAPRGRRPTCAPRRGRRRCARPARGATWTRARCRR